MNTKLIIAATVAALSLSTIAFAGERDQTGALHPLTEGGTALMVGFDNSVVPPNGSNGPVESANSLPAGAMNGTGPVLYAQSVNHYFAQQADHRFAQLQATGGHHS